jgi:hypothetical protein
MPVVTIVSHATRLAQAEGGTAGNPADGPDAEDTGS